MQAEIGRRVSTRLLAMTFLWLAALSMGGVPAAHAQIPSDGLGGGESGPRFLLAVGPSTTNVVPLDIARAPVLMRRISLNLENVSVKEALAAIAKQSGAHFVYTEGSLASRGPISLNAQGITTAAALTDVLVNAEVDLVFSRTGDEAVLVKRPARVQNGTIVGEVTDAGSRQGLAGATVQVEGAHLGAATDENGHFRIANVPPGTHVVIARRIGYTPERRTVTVPDGKEVTVTFALETAATSLDQIVVTGTAGGEQRRSIGNVVSTINAPEELTRSGVGNVGTLLNGRAPGVIVTAGTGRVGSGPSINIRGKSTLSLSQQPLLYIDGVRVINDIGTGPGSQGGQVASRFNDIAPEDIESIEIIKGPAAATIYGTEGANGVIQIITKKGRMDSNVQWTLLLRQGMSFFRDPEGRMPTNYGFDPTTNQILSWNPVQQENDRGTPLFRNGRDQTYSVSAGGATQIFNYYASGTWDQDTGIEPNNGQRRFSSHANLALTPNAKFDVSTSLNVVKGRTRLGSDFGPGAFYASVFGSPLTASTPSRGFFGAPPEVTWDLVDNTQAVDRFTGGLQANNHLTGWFTQRLNLGLDLTTEDNQALQRFATPDQAIFYPASEARGSIAQNLREVSYVTVDYGASAKFPLSSSLASTTSLGAQIYRRRTNTTFASGSQFPAPGVTTVAATTTQNIGSQDYVINKTIGMYGQEQIGWNDRLFLTGALRVDNNTAFGKQFHWATYPKVSASWVISEEPWWNSKIVNTLKLRSAYGLSGQQPLDFAALRSYQAATGTNDQPAVTPQLTGNPGLKPERSQEFEMGFEANLFNRLTLDFTHYNKRTKDAILSRQVAPSSGFPGTQYVNIGEISNHGIELEAHLQAVMREDFAWEIGANVATNKDRIEDLGGIPFIAFAGVPQRNAEGYPIGGYWSRRVVSATLDANGVPTNVMCDGGSVSESPLPCAQAPAVFLGTATPTHSGAITNTFTFGKRLRLYGMVDFKGGHKLLNVDEWARCAAFLLCEANYRPEKYSAVYDANIQNGGGFYVADKFVQPAGFARLREVSVSYDLPSSFAHPLRADNATVSLVGRNLHIWTKYGGLDPESRESVTHQNIFEQASTPALMQFLITVRLGF